MIAALLAAALALGGCVTLPVPSLRRAARALPPALADAYHYPPISLQAKITSRETRSGYSLEKLELRAPDSAGRPIRLDWYKPEGKTQTGRLPLVLISPILAGNDLVIREFAAFYAARGMHAVIVYRQKEPFSADRPLKDVEEHLKQTIIEMRRALDWLVTQESVDPRRIGTFAISLGAILTAILAAVEPRVRCSVLGLPAGHVAEIIMTSKDKSLRKKRRAVLEHHGWDQQRGLEELQAVISSEPMRFAGVVDPGRVLIIAGLFDRVLGLGRTLELWRAMGRPRLILLPTGHYSAYLATPYLKMATYSFLRRRLSG